MSYECYAFTTYYQFSLDVNAQCSRIKKTPKAKTNQRTQKQNKVLVESFKLIFSHTFDQFSSSQTSFIFP